jgi:signal transduction histidine kinase/DNA-binding response OmpR family regulator
MQSTRLNTLRTKLIVVLLIAALAPLAILTFLNKRSTEEALADNANQRLSAIAFQTAISIDTFIETNLDAVRVEAVVPVLSRYLSLKAEDPRAGGEDEAAAAATLLGFSRKDTINIASYALLDLQGRNIFDTRVTNIGQDESNSDYFRHAIKTGVPYVSTVMFSGKTPQLFFSSPVRDSRKVTIGVLRLSYNASVIEQIVIEQTASVGSKSFAILLDEHNIRLGHSSEPDLVFKSLAPLSPKLIKELQAERRLPDLPIKELSTNLPQFDRDLSSAKETFQTRMDETGDELDAVVVARLRARPWTVAVVQPQRFFLAPIVKQTRNALVLALLIAGVVTGLAIVAAQFLTKPIIHVAHAASQLASGKLDTTVAVQSRDEMGILAQSFNQMARQLQESFAKLAKTNEELENRVEQRTVELKDAMVVADAANKAKSDFLANMSHELRTPLNGILGYAQILRRSKRMAEEEVREIDIISQCGSHLLTLINDVLDLAKIESQTMELHASDFHFQAFLRSTVEICRIRAEQKGIAFVYKPDTSALPTGVRADERRLRQVLINLLGNAVKFTEKGSVTFRVTKLASGQQETQGDRDRPEDVTGEEAQSRSHTIRFEIEDTGSGISSDQLDQIFLPFKQAGDGKRRIEGTGLGLTISQRIVKLMGSSIEVKSELDKGSTFWMDVTLTESSKWAQTAKRTEQGMVVGYDGRRQRVMVVDDQWENRAVVVKMLESIGFEVIEATDGQEGLDKAVEGKFDLIITDLVMPVLDGWEMMQRLRKMPELQGVTIIASSASVFSSDLHKSLDAGADDFIPKPLQMDELLQKIQQHLKLTWTYEQQDGARGAGEAPRDSEETQNLSDPDVVAPSAEELAALLDLTRKGLVNQIQKYVDKLDRADPKLAPFAKHLRRLSRDFRLDAMEKFIRKCINNTA